MSKMDFSPYERIAELEAEREEISALRDAEHAERLWLQDQLAAKTKEAQTVTAQRDRLRAFFDAHEALEDARVNFTGHFNTTDHYNTLVARLEIARDAVLGRRES